MCVCVYCHVQVSVGACVFAVVTNVDVFMSLSCISTAANSFLNAAEKN